MSNKIKPIIGMVIISALIFGIYLAGNRLIINNPDGAEVHFIDVAHGDSILIRCGNENMLIDGGTDYAADTVISYLESLGVDNLDIVVATHPHDDHIGGLDDVVGWFGADKIYMPDEDCDTVSYSQFWEEVKDDNIIHPDVGDEFSVGEADFKVLASPSGAYYNDPNNYSLCLKMTYGLNSFVFTGDAEAVIERDMVLSGADLTADVLKAGHHGSKSSSCEEFLDAVHPAITVISTDKDGDYNLPAEEVVERLGKYGAVYRTDINGNIVVSSDGENLEVSYDLK